MISARMYVCVCVYAASMMAPPYPGMMYQTSQGMVYAAAPTSALQNGVIFSLSQGQLQLQHAAADCGMSSVCCAPACLPKVCAPSFKHLFLFVCACVCVAVYTVSSLVRCFYLARVLQFRPISPERVAALFVVCQLSGIMLSQRLHFFCLVFPFLKTFVNIGLILN